MTDFGHRDTFAAPSRGWPTFGPDGKIVRDDTDTDTDETTDDASAEEPEQ